MVRRRPWLTRRTGGDPDIDRINEIANDLVVASLALDLGDEESARSALDEARERASRLLTESVVAHDARERRRYISRWATGATTAAGVALVATLVLIHPAAGPDTPVPVAHAPTPEATTVDQVERSIAATIAPPHTITTADDRLRTREAAAMSDTGLETGPDTRGTSSAAGPRQAPPADAETAPEQDAPVHRGSEASDGRADPAAGRAEPPGARSGDQGPGDRRNA